VSTAGLILAAGESRRMGTPKALLEYRGETFLDRLVRLFSARCAPVIVVLGAHAEDIRARSGARCTFVVNADWRIGQTSSMQCGLRSMPAGVEGVLFTLVDHPAVSERTIDALTEPRPSGSGTHDSELGVPLPYGPGSVLRVPRFQQRRGHPIWFSSALIPEFLAIPPTGAAREVVRAHAAETEFLDVDDAGILADIDDPAAYRMLTGVQA
jgi:CTP:molybdopterin cytidylyltransferase MocA